MINPSNLINVSAKNQSNTILERKKYSQFFYCKQNAILLTNIDHNQYGTGCSSQRNVIKKLREKNGKLKKKCTFLKSHIIMAKIQENNINSSTARKYLAE